MRDFSFIVLTYNHANYVADCLNSIRDIIIRYGSAIKFELIIADDSSKDNTIDIVNKWVECNKVFFRNVKILVSKKNRGTVRNLFCALDNCNTEALKFISGDDKFVLSNNIFELFHNVVYEDRKPHLTVTPVITFGEGNNSHVEKITRIRFLMAQDCNNNGKLKKLIKNGCAFAAPGVFIPKEFLIDDKFKEFLFGFRNIEDYPMWYFFIIKKNYDVSIYDKPYVQYRIGSGISSNKKKGENSGFSKEVDFMNKKLHVRNYILPKYINPFRYWTKFVELKATKEWIHNK